MTILMLLPCALLALAGFWLAESVARETVELEVPRKRAVR